MLAGIAAVYSFLVGGCGALRYIFSSRVLVKLQLFVAWIYRDESPSLQGHNMLTNIPRKSGSVRVVFFFLAFVGVCVYTPILIDDLIRGRSSPEQAVAQGQDPTAVYEHPGAGQSGDAERCASAEYVYGKSLDSYLFVRKTNNNLYAVDVGGTTTFFSLDNDGVVVGDSVNINPKTDIARDLASVLTACMNSGAKPSLTNIRIKPTH